MESIKDWIFFVRFASQVESSCLPKGFTILKYRVSTSVLCVEVSFRGGGSVQESMRMNIQTKNRNLMKKIGVNLDRNEGVMD